MLHLKARSIILWYVIFTAEICFHCQEIIPTEPVDSFPIRTHHEESSVVSSSYATSNTSATDEEQVNSSDVMSSTKQHQNLTIPISQRTSLSYDGATQSTVETGMPSTDSLLTSSLTTSFLQFTNISDSAGNDNSDNASIAIYSTSTLAKNISSSTIPLFTNTSQIILTTPFNETAYSQTPTSVYITAIPLNSTVKSFQTEGMLTAISPTESNAFTSTKETLTSKSIDMLSDSPFTNEINSDDELQSIPSVSNISQTVIFNEINAEVTVQDTLTTTPLSLHKTHLSSSTTRAYEEVTSEDQPLSSFAGTSMEENISVKISSMPSANFSAAFHEITMSPVGNTYPNISKTEISVTSTNSSFPNLSSAEITSTFLTDASDETPTHQAIEEHSNSTSSIHTINMTTDLLDNENETVTKTDSLILNTSSSSPTLTSNTGIATQFTSEVISESLFPTFTTQSETTSSFSAADNNSTSFSILTHVFTGDILTTAIDKEPTSTLLTTVEAKEHTSHSLHLMESTTPTATVSTLSLKDTEGTVAESKTSLYFSSERSTDATEVHAEIVPTTSLSHTSSGKENLITQVNATLEDATINSLLTSSTEDTTIPPGAIGTTWSPTSQTTEAIIHEKETVLSSSTVIMTDKDEITFSNGYSTLSSPSLTAQMNTNVPEREHTVEAMPTYHETTSTTSRKEFVPTDGEYISDTPVTSKRDSEFVTGTFIHNEIEQSETTMALLPTISSDAVQNETVHGIEIMNITTKDTGFTWEPFLYQKSVHNLTKEEMDNIITLVFHAPKVTEQIWQNETDVIFRNFVSMKLAVYLRQSDVKLSDKENDLTTHSSGAVILDDLVYISPTPCSEGDNFIISFVHYVTKDGTRSVTSGSLILHVLNENKKIMEDTLEMNIQNMYLGVHISVNEEAVSLENSIFKQYWIAVISLAVIGAISLVAIFFTIMYMRTRNRRSHSYAHDMTHLKGDMEATNEIGDLNSSVDLLRDEMCEKILPGLSNGSGAHIIKMGDDECWVVPYSDIPLEDKNPPDIQDTKL